MLILTRKPGEALVLDGGIRVTVLSTDGRSVRVGIEAPSEVRILRAEIVESVESETRRAAAAAAQWVARSGAGRPTPTPLSAPPRVPRDDSQPVTAG